MLFGLFFLNLVNFVNEFLLSLNIFEHVLTLWKYYVIREYLRVFIIERAEFRKSDLSLSCGIGPLQELINVIQNQIVFENRYNMSIFVVNEVIYDFNIIVISVCRVPLTQVVLYHCS